MLDEPRFLREVLKHNEMLKPIRQTLELGGMVGTDFINVAVVRLLLEHDSHPDAIIGPCETLMDPPSSYDLKLTKLMLSLWGSQLGISPCPRRARRILLFLQGNNHYAVLCIDIPAFVRNGPPGTMRIYDSLLQPATVENAEMRWKDQLSKAHGILDARGIPRCNVVVAADVPQQAEGSNNCAFHSILTAHALSLNPTESGGAMACKWRAAAALRSSSQEWWNDEAKVQELANTWSESPNPPVT